MNDFEYCWLCGKARIQSTTQSVPCEHGCCNAKHPDVFLPIAKVMTENPHFSGPITLTHSYAYHTPPDVKRRYSWLKRYITMNKCDGRGTDFPPGYRACLYLFDVERNEWVLGAN